MNAVPGRQGAPRAVFEYVKENSDRGGTKTYRGYLFDTLLR